jgi:sigma-B regulation protein RsbU (phosphoserine phosphatase)
MSEIPLQISPDGRHAVPVGPTAEGQAVQESERRYRQLLEAVTSYTYSVDVVDGEPSSTVHRGGCLAATGYAPEEYRSHPYLWFDMVHPEDRPRVQEHVANVLAGQDVPPLEHRILHKNGKTRWVRDTVVVHRDERGRVVRYDGLVEDITDRKLVEERFRRLLESAPDAMVVVDRSGQIVLVNSQTEKFFGYSRDEMLGQSLEVLLPERFRGPHAGFREAFFANPRTRPMGTRPHIPCRRKDGSEFPADISLSLIDMEEGALAAAAIRDVTAQRRAEESLRENHAQLLAAQKIQKHLLPDGPPALAGYDVAGFAHPSVFAGGDFFDYLAMLGGYTGFVIGDVSGHGFASALLMASAQAFLRSLAQTCATIGEILVRANRFIIEQTKEEDFVTLLLARLDPKTRSLSYTSAGHPSGYVLDSLGAVRAELRSTALPLGVLEDAEFPPGEPVALQAGDTVLVLTDGILEAESPDGGRFGTERALEVVRLHLQEPAGVILEKLHRAVLDFSRREDPSDDLTAVLIKVAG